MVTAFRNLTVTELNVIAFRNLTVTELIVTAFGNLPVTVLTKSIQESDRNRTDGSSI